MKGGRKYQKKNYVRQKNNPLETAFYLFLVAKTLKGQNK